MRRYHWPSGEVIDIINRRGRAHPKRIVGGRMRSRRIVVWVSVILLGLIAILVSISIGASLRQKTHSLHEEKSGNLQTVLDENAERQQDTQRMEQDPSFLPLFEFFRAAVADSEMYRETLEVLFRLNREEVSRAYVVLQELHPLYAEIVKYQGRVETGDLDEPLFDGLKALMQTTFTTTMARICGQPSTACYKWGKFFVTPPAPQKQSSKPDVEI